MVYSDRQGPLFSSIGVGPRGNGIYLSSKVYEYQNGNVYTCDASDYVTGQRGSIHNIRVGDVVVFKTQLSDISKFNLGVVDSVVDDKITFTSRAEINVGTYQELADESVTTDKMADESVTTDKMADESVTTDKIADDAITSDKVADGAIGQDALDSTGVTSGSYGDTANQTPTFGGKFKSTSFTVDSDGRLTSAGEHTVQIPSIPDMSTSVKGIAKVGAGLAMNGDALELDGSGDIAAAVTAWLNAHPEATTTVQDGAITTAKLANNSVTDEKLAQSGGILDKINNGLAYSAMKIRVIAAGGGVTTDDYFLPMKSGDKLYVKNNTSGNVTPQLLTMNPRTIAQAFGAIPSGESRELTATTSGTHVCAYLGSAVEQDEEVEIDTIQPTIAGMLSDINSELNDFKEVMDFGKDVVCSPSTTVIFPISDSYGKKYAITNNTSGNITPQLYNGNTQVKVFTTVPSGETSIIAIDVIADSIQMYCGSSVVNGETVKISRYDTIINRMAHGYTCMKDGTGDFSSLVDAINTVCEEMDATLYVGPGTWDLIDELGNDYLNSVDGDNRGLYLKNRVHVICSSDALITCHYTGSRADTITWLSAFNSGDYGFTLENARIESSNCRYAIHDEMDTHTIPYTNKYINCTIVHDNSLGGYAACIGGGLGKDGHIIIDGCIFQTLNPQVVNAGIVSYHNTWYSGGDGRSFVDVKGCLFKDTNTFRCSWFGASQEISTFLVHGNSMGAAPIHTVENQQMMDDHPTWIVNTELIAWNNEIRSS